MKEPKVYQTPVPIWNEIVESQQLLHREMERLFSMDQEELFKALEDEDKKLEARGLDSTTIVAYHLTAPLLLENEAISRYIQQTNQQFLRASLPELTTVNEAIYLATQEYRLTPSQTKKLRTLLEAALRTE